MFLVTALFMLPGIAMTLVVREPPLRKGAPRTLREAVVEPFHEFITRAGWREALLVLAFIFLYKLGDSMATALATPFYLDMGFTRTDIGVIAKNAGLWASVIGGMLGGLWMVKIGINRGLWLFGVVQTGVDPGLLRCWRGSHQPDRVLLAFVIAFEALGVGLGTAAFVAFIARATDPRYTATQFALFTSLAAVPADRRQRLDRLDRGRDRLVQLLPALHAAGVAGNGTTLACGTLARSCQGEGSAMNPHKFSAIAHRDHDYCNPIEATKIERLLDLLPLDETSRVLDLGCGRAELALRIIERFGSTVVAVDRSSMMLDAARERAEWTGALGKLHLDDVDIADYRADPETFHLSVMLGAGGISGGMAGICAQLKHWTRSGGYILIGEGFWRQKPHSEYLALLGGHGHPIPRPSRQRAGRHRRRPHSDARDDRVDGRVGRVRVEVLPRDRALCARAARGPRHPGDARAQPALARRVSALGARHARLRDLPLLPAGLADGLMAVASWGSSTSRSARSTRRGPA